MSLTDELAAANATRPVNGARCGIAATYDNLDADTASELRAALGDTTIPSTVIASVLRKRGIKVGEYTVQRHRKLGCKCDAL